VSALSSVDGSSVPRARRVRAPGARGSRRRGAAPREPVWPRPGAEVLLAELGGAPVGFALFFPNYSTFLARPGLYLEDLFVLPSARGRGCGLALMSALARIAIERDYGRFEWSVLDWNRPALDFYEQLGAHPRSEWTVQRLVGAPLAILAAYWSRPVPAP